jgi:hypothetical protein
MLCLTAAALLASALLAGCAPVERIAAPTATPAGVLRAPDAPLPTDVVRRRLLQAADGLLYTSESDRPFTWIFREGPAAAPLDVTAYRAAFGVPADVPVEQVALDDFFARHIERVDPADAAASSLVPRYRHLRETLRRTLRDVRVFRAGRIAIDCDIVGVDADGHVVGLRTVAIET